MKLFKAKRVDIQGDGLAKILGSLEADMLEFIWQEKKATAREVCDHLNRSKSISFNAVNTVLNRLVEKGILTRKQGGQCYIFRARYSKDVLCQMVSQDIFSALLRDKKLFSIAGFTEAVENLSTHERQELLQALNIKKKK